MTIFDTDVLVEVLVGNPRFVKRASAIPQDQQGVTIVTVEEVLRGRLHAIRQAEAGKGPITVARAYELLDLSVNDFQWLSVISYSDGADAAFRTGNAGFACLPTICVSPRSAWTIPQP